MISLHTGALLNQTPGPKYQAQLDFAEILPEQPLPRPGTLRKWRKDLPEDFTLSLVAPRDALVSDKGALRMTEEMETKRTWLGHAADALGARFLVIPTLGDLTPGLRDRQLLKSWVEGLKLPEHTTLVWHPSGLWEMEAAIDMANELGCILAFDPIEADVLPEGEVVYARLRGIGMRKRFSEDLLIDVVESIAELSCEENFVAFESERSFREAARLKALFAEALELAAEEYDEGEDESDSDFVDEDDGDDDDFDGEDDFDGDDDDA